MSVGLKDISNATGYSVSTVSRVLSSKISGNSESAVHIIQAARDMGYSKYRASINPNNRILDIALITQHFSEEFYAYLYSAFDKMGILAHLRNTLWLCSPNICNSCHDTNVSASREW